MAIRDSNRGVDLKEFEQFHCPKCSYPLKGITQPFCPECGAELKPGEVFKQRKYGGVILLPAWVGRYGVAVLILAVALGFTMAEPVGIAGRHHLYIWVAGFGVLMYAIWKGKD